MRNRFHSMVCLLVLGSCLVLEQKAVSVQLEVPNGMRTVEGNDASRLPFAYIGPVRYQQVFDASQFGGLPEGGAYLTRIFFRRNCASSNNWIVTNFQVNVSTTLNGPDELSPVFSENVGADEILAFGPRDYIPPGGNSSSCPNPSTFGHGQEINLEKPFFYNPALGNLLLDMRQDDISYRFETNWPPNLPRPRLEDSLLDAETAAGDPVSRIAAFSLTTNTAEVVETTGLVTQFQFDSIPSLTNSMVGNEVVITWPTLPNTFSLHWAARLGTDTMWRPYTNSIGGNAQYRALTLPFENLTSSMYFRLAWEDGPPIPQSGGSTNSLPP